MAVKKRKKSRFEFLTRKFPLRMQRKLVMLLFVAIILAFVVLIGRITYINVTKGSKYTKVVLDQQNYDSRVIAFKRGDIVDRNGTKMATSERVYKKAFSHEKAMEMILAGECGTFNPLLLECLQDIQGRIQGEMKRAEEQPMLVQNSYVGKMIETVQ
jgi:hypothetical protein